MSELIITGFDTETTGLMTPEHRIVEVGLVMRRFNVDTGEVQHLAKFERRFNPGRPMDPKAQAVHGIAFEDVAHCPRLEDDDKGIELIQRILAKSDLIVAHNGEGFDKPFLAQEFARIGKPLPAYLLADTMLQGRWATPLGKVPNLGELCFACRVPYDPDKAHGALYDVEVMLDCFQFGLRRDFFKLPPSLVI